MFFEIIWNLKGMDIVISFFMDIIVRVKIEVSLDRIFIEVKIIGSMRFGV